MQSTKVIVTESVKAHSFADLALDVGTYLLSSGAHSGRVKGNIERLADAWGLTIDMSQSFKGLLVSVCEIGDNDHKVTSYRTSPPHRINFSVLAEVSDLTWEIVEKNEDMDYFKNKFAEIKSKKHSNFFLVSLAVGVSCAGLTLTANGDLTNAFFALMGTFIGSLLRFSVTNAGWNHTLAIGLAAFTTTLITGLGSIFGLGEYPEIAIAMSVLYLIPGAPLVNAVIDLIDGYIAAAVQRVVFSGFILLAIASGMTLCITLLGINNLTS